jgi:AcrR family transcriptional regulator
MMPKAFTDYEKQIISERLLEEGRKQFSMYGLKKARIEELAEAVGISKGAFYLFYDSKEALFMDVAEQAESAFRQEVLAAVDLPGPSARARLIGVLRTAFTVWKSLPLLRMITRSDYERLTRRVPPEQVREHVLSDQTFVETLVARCREAGIPITAPVEQISGLLYAIFFATLHEDDFGPQTFPMALNTLTEIVAAFCLGEIEMTALQQRDLPAGGFPGITGE